MNRVNKIEWLFKIATSNSIDAFFESDNLPVFTAQSPRDLITFVQSNLIKAGYPLPEFGADGVVGEETIAAINNFRSDIGKSSVQVGSEVLLEQSDVSKLIQAVGLSDEATLDRLRELRTRSLGDIVDSINLVESGEGGILLFGDSQMQGGIGDVLQAKYPGERLSKQGSQAYFWLGNSRLEEELSKKPSLIIIQLNSNGILGTRRLLEKIMKITPNSRIKWYGSPPATISRTSWSPQVRTPEALRAFNSRRRGYNSTVEGYLASSGLSYEFINPFDIIGFTNWTCRSCDGIHVPKSVAQKYYARV
jgi:hypothetical protein